MSAKRLKVEGFHRERRERLPIPSFRNNNAHALNSDPTLLISLHWHNDVLMSVDCALQVWFSTNNQSSMMLKALYEFLEKFTLHRPDHCEADANVSGTTRAFTQDLSDCEQLLFDWLLVAMPKHYVLRPASAGLVLEKVANAEVRMVGALLDDVSAYVPQSTVQELLQLIKSHPSRLQSRPQQSNEASLVIPAGTTIDEQVRARTVTTRHQQPQQESNATTLFSTGHSTKEELVRIGDALWQHARDIQTRQQRYQSPQRKTTMTTCTMTITDVVGMLTRVCGRSKREIVHDIMELRSLVPDWIKVTDDDENANSLSKNATIWIFPANYKQARAIMTDKPLADALSRPIYFTETVNSKRPFLTPEGSHGTNAEYKVVTAEESTPPLLFSKKARVEAMSAPGPLRIKRPLEQICPETSPLAKKHKMLRINPHLILGDADHTGGEIIAPSFHQSPRGLKALFRQLNSGQRI